MRHSIRSRSGLFIRRPLKGIHPRIWHLKMPLYIDKILIKIYIDYIYAYSIKYINKIEIYYNTWKQLYYKKKPRCCTTNSLVLVYDRYPFKKWRKVYSFSGILYFDIIFRHVLCETPKSTSGIYKTMVPGYP